MSEKRELWVSDFETDPFEFEKIPEVFLIGIYRRDDTGKIFYKEFTNVTEFVSFIKDKRIILYMHNGGKFDFHYIADDININEKILMINSRLVKGKIGNCEIRDSYALLPFPLKSYNKKEIDYKKLHKKVRHLHMEEIKEYLRYDCEYLFDLIEAFHDNYGSHLTAAGASIKMLCKIEDIKIEDYGITHFDDYQRYYFGGRCEALKTGSHFGEITYLDINSAYPFAMLHMHPIGNEVEITYNKKPKIVGHGFYTIKAKSYGALCRRKKEGGLIFDWDGEVLEYHTTGHEILAGLETKTLVIVEHIEQRVFKHNRDFKHFVSHFWELRKETVKNTPENLFAKLMLNSSYGKWAANPQEYETFMMCDPKIAATVVRNGWDIKGQFGKNMVISKPLEHYEMRFYNVATAASITGFVRALLIKALNGVDKPLYCDTDSIMFKGKHNLQLSDKLGAWKVEGIFTEMHIGGKKMYAGKNAKEEKMAHKGAKLTYKDIVDVANGKTILYCQDAPSFSWTNKTKFIQRKIRKTG